jgi:hypothetical protein
VFIWNTPWEELLTACSNAPLNTFTRKYKPSMNRVALGLVHTTRAALDAAKSAGSHHKGELNSYKKEIAQLKSQLQQLKRDTRRKPAPPRDTSKPYPECWRDLGRSRYHYPCDPVKREAAVKRTAAKSSTTHMVTRIRCDTRGMPPGTQLCPHCSLEEGRAWTTCDHLHKFGPEQCFSRPGGPLQGRPDGPSQGEEAQGALTGALRPIHQASTPGEGPSQRPRQRPRRQR